MPRAATTWIVRRLNEHPDVTAVGESQFFGNHWVPPGDDGTYGPTELATVRRWLADNPFDSSVPLPADVPAGPGWLANTTRDDLAAVLADAFGGLTAPAAPAEVWAAVARAFATRERTSVVVEKTPHHVRHVGRLCAVSPDTKVLLMVRDPYGFALSYKHQGDRKSGEKKERSERRYHAIGVGLLWRSYWRYAAAAVAAHPDRTLVVRMEDVGERPARVLADVADRLGLDHPDAWGPAAARPRDNSSFPDGGARRLDPAERWIVNRLVRSAASDAGYALEPVRFPVVGLLRQAVTAVPWAVANLREASGRVSGSKLRWLASLVGLGRKRS